MRGRVSQWRDDPACHGCGAPRPADAWAKHWRGPYCRSCNERWTYHGRPEGGPPPPRHAAPGSREGRLEDFADLLEQGESLEIARVRLGVSRDTAERYRADLRRSGRLVPQGRPAALREAGARSGSTGLRCPTCGAEPGQKCRSLKTRRPTDTHVRRKGEAS